MIGRVGVDLYPNELETPLRGGAHVHALRRRLRRQRRRPGWRGSACARRSSRASAPTATASSCATWLAGEGVDVRFLATDPYWQTPPTFCEVWPPDRFPITFYRTSDRARLAALARRLRRATRSPRRRSSTRPAPGSRSRRAARRRSRRSRAHRGTTIFDLDWRADALGRPGEYPALAAEAAADRGHRDRQRGGGRGGAACATCRERSCSSAASAARRSSSEGEADRRARASRSRS